MAKIVNDYVYKKGNLKLNDGINLSDNLQVESEMKLMKIIIYGSQYGTAKQYAEELSKETNIKAESFEKIKNIDEYI